MSDSFPSFGQSARRAGFEHVCGVPDSLLASAISSLRQEFSPKSFVVAANEGNSVGLAIGNFLATGKPSLVFMQNSGLGNAINPLISLANERVYSIPVVLLIGWRAEIYRDGRQASDEPQHVAQGAATLAMLAAARVPYLLLDSGSDVQAVLAEAFDRATVEAKPIAIVVSKGAVASDKREVTQTKTLPTREDYVDIALNYAISFPSGQQPPIVSTTGYTSRELSEKLDQLEEPGFEGAFFVVGGMGHTSSIASAVASRIFPRRVICLDGDGSLLMHMGALVEAGRQSNIIYILLDNGVHDSVGGQPTSISMIDIEQLAKAVGFSNFVQASSMDDAIEFLDLSSSMVGSVFLHFRCSPGVRSDLARPTNSPKATRDEFMNFLGLNETESSSGC